MTEPSESTGLLITDSLPEQTDARGRCCGVIRNEFNLRNFGFGFDQEEVFYNCQWPCPKAVYLIYRFILMTYAVIVIILSLTVFDNNKTHRPWPVFLTHWSYSLLVAHLLSSFVISLIHRRDDRIGIHGELDSSERWIIRRRQPVRFYLKLSWLLFVLSSAAAFIVTSIYFGALFPQRGIHYLSPVDINLHLMNSVIVILEMFVSAFPVRLFHAFYVMIYVAVYALFSVFYWIPDHSNVIYPGVLDWNYPVHTLIFGILILLIGIPFLQIILFCLYRLRMLIYHKCCFNRYIS